MHISTLDKPRLRWPLMGRGRFIVKRCSDVIDPDVFGLGKIGGLEQLLNGRTNPCFLGRTKRCEGGNPRVRLVLFSSIRIISANLRPAAVLLHIRFRGDVKAPKIAHALYTLGSRAHHREHRKEQNRQNSNDDDNDQ